MLYVEAVLIVLATLGLCFFVGKKLGERKFRRVNDEMKALELSFNQLLEQMELTSAHNLKVLETKTEDLRVLLPIVDKKLLQAHDLTQQLEELSARKPVPSAASPVDPARDQKYRRDLQEALTAVQQRLGLFEERLQTLEHRVTQTEQAREQQVWESRRQAARVVPVAEMPFAAAVSDKVVDIKTREVRKEREAAVASAPEMSPALAAIARQVDEHLQEVRHLREVTVGVAGESRRLETVPAPEPEPAFSPLPADLPEELTQDEPAPGTLFYDVLTLTQQGVTIPQIARRLNLGNGEVELIVKLYGSRFNLRKVM